jgi:hypothetical protein
MKKIIVVLLLITATAMFAKTSTYDLTFVKNNGLYTITVKINGTNRVFLVDTGATRTVFFTQVLEGAMIRRDTPIYGTGGNVAAGFVAVNFEVGSKSFNSKVIVLEDTLSAKFGTHIDGIIGQDVLSSFRMISIDYKNKKLILED